MRFLPFLIFLAVLQGCSLLKSDDELSNHQNMITGEWYFGMKQGRFLKMIIKEDHSFQVYLLPCKTCEGKPAPGGTWQLDNDNFSLKWPDGTIKSQVLKSVSQTRLELKNPTTTEVYYREPKENCS